MSGKTLLLVAVMVGASSSHAANLLNNGSFESPHISDVRYFDLGSTFIDGWNVVGGQVALVPDTFASLLASDGHQWMDLTGGTGYGKGLQSNAVSTVLGQTYTLTFDVGNYVAVGYGTSTLSVSINNGSAILFTNIVNGSSGMDWERKSLTWVANATTANLTFLGAANTTLSNDQVIGLDNVVFAAVPVPEPESYAMLLAGLGLMGAVARRRKSKKA